MTNPQALTAAAKAMEYAIWDRVEEHHNWTEEDHCIVAAAAITAYLNALPPISEGIVERVARAIATGCNLDPDAISPKTAALGHSIPEWHFFVPAAHKAIESLSLQLAQGEG